MIEPHATVLPLASVADQFADAITFIFSGSESVTANREVGGLDQVWELTREHLKVTFLAVGVALVLALPVGVVAGHYRRGDNLAISVGNAGRALPELAVIAFMLAFGPASWFGLTDVIIALMILGLPPILINSSVGVRQVDLGAVEAARGMGMNDLEIIARIELPLALPTIMGGVRTAALNIIATATIAPLAGVLTLGDFILSRNVYGDQGVLAGAILVAALALLLELSLAGVQRALTPKGLRLARERAAT
jgi:osmoprotectant transport system permease protein